MYFFYFDESGSRDLSVGTPENPKPHLYVVLAVGMYERQWPRFETAISKQKLVLINCLQQDGKGPFELADCEVKSNWVRIQKEREKRSPFLSAISEGDRKRLVRTYFQQLSNRRMVIMATVIDKRELSGYKNPDILHETAYEFILEEIQHYMNEYHPKHNALIVMDHMDKRLNRAIAMKQASLLRSGNKNMKFPAVVEYPFFVNSELSNGVQLADLLAYNVYHAFSYKDLDYAYFQKLLPHIHRGRDGKTLHGLKVWPESSPLVQLAESV